jgi:hypothetical protein
MSSLFDLSRVDKEEHLLNATPVWLKINFKEEILSYYNKNTIIKYKKFTCCKCMHSFPFYENDSTRAEPCGYCDGVEFFVFDILSNNNEIQDGVYSIHCSVCYNDFEEGKFNFGLCKICGASGAEYARMG